MGGTQLCIWKTNMLLASIKWLDYETIRMHIKKHGNNAVAFANPFEREKIQNQMNAQFWRASKHEKCKADPPANAIPAVHVRSLRPLMFQPQSAQIRLSDFGHSAVWICKANPCCFQDGVFPVSRVVIGFHPSSNPSIPGCGFLNS